MRVRSRLMLATLSTIVTVTVVTGCASAQAPSSATSARPVSVPSGTAGAAHFDEGFLAVGSGPKVVDLYVDPMCPYCKLFEQASGAALFSDAAERRTTIRVHPVAILNRLSQGTAYSTRAAAVLAAVAAKHPDKTQTFFQELYQQQPAENTTGLDDAALVRLANSVGADLQLSDAALAPYRAWVDKITAAATAGPLTSTTEVPAISHVPTVVVNGAVFPGNSDERDAFAAFYTSH